MILCKKQSQTKGSEIISNTSGTSPVVRDERVNLKSRLLEVTAAMLNASSLSSQRSSSQSESSLVRNKYSEIKSGLACFNGR